MDDYKRLYPLPMSEDRAQSFDTELNNEVWMLVQKLWIAYPELTQDSGRILMGQCLMKVARYKDQSN
jgi:hypothetical protein